MIHIRAMNDAPFGTRASSMSWAAPPSESMSVERQEDVSVEINPVRALSLKYSILPSSPFPFLLLLIPSAKALPR